MVQMCLVAGAQLLCCNVDVVNDSVVYIVVSFVSWFSVVCVMMVTFAGSNIVISLWSVLRSYF